MPPEAAGWSAFEAVVLHCIKSHFHKYVEGGGAARASRTGKNNFWGGGGRAGPGRNWQIFLLTVISLRQIGSTGEIFIVFSVDLEKMVDSYKTSHAV